MSNFTHQKRLENIIRATEIQHRDFLTTIYILQELFTSSFGPKGLDKLLLNHLDNDMIISNDGATILDELNEYLEPQFAKIVIGWGKTLSRQFSDGVKSFYLLLGELSKKIEELDGQGIPRGLILKALSTIQTSLPTFFKSSLFTPTSSLNSEILYHIIFSLFSGRLASSNLDALFRVFEPLLPNLLLLFSETNFARSNLESIVQFEMNPGTRVQETQFIPGVLIAKPPVNASLIKEGIQQKARLLLVSEKLYFDLPDGGQLGPQGFEVELNLNTPDAPQQIQQFMRKKAEHWASLLLACRPDVIITERGVHRDVQGMLEKHGIIIIRRAKPEDFQQLLHFLNNKAVEDVTQIEDSHISLIDYEWKKIGRDRHFLIQKSALKSEHIPNNLNNLPFLGTFLVGGANWYVCEEVRRFIKKILQFLFQYIHYQKMAPGGGRTELHLAKFILDLSPNNPNIAYIVQHLATAFEIIPRCLLQSTGVDLQDYLSRLKHSIFFLNQSTVINLASPKLFEDMHTAHIMDDFSAKEQIIKMVLEISIQLWRIDSGWKIKRKA